MPFLHAPFLHINNVFASDIQFCARSTENFGENATPEVKPS